jgi:hypothetical protein
VKKSPDIADRDELLRLLTVQARNGAVTAQKALLDELRRGEGADPEAQDGFEELDNVTSIRRHRG